MEITPVMMKIAHRNTLRSRISQLASQIVAELWPLAHPVAVASALRPPTPTGRNRRWFKLPGWKVSQVKRLAKRLDISKRGTRAEIARRTNLNPSLIAIICGGK